MYWREGETEIVYMERKMKGIMRLERMNKNFKSCKQSLPRTTHTRLPEEPEETERLGIFEEEESVQRKKGHDNECCLHHTNSREERKMPLIFTNG